MRQRPGTTMSRSRRLLPGVAARLGDGADEVFVLVALAHEAVRR